MDDSSSNSDNWRSRVKIWFGSPIVNLFWNIFCHLLAALQAANLAVALAPLTKIIQNKKRQKILFDKFYDQ